ncbi:MAG: histidine kinase [Acidobacteriota bacterium]|nr:histidine kinase [Acidobacteriota bacterium]
MKIRNLFSFWAEEPKCLADMPPLLFKVAVFGGLVGIVLSIFGQLFSGNPAPNLAELPVWLLYSVGIGAIFSLSFYTTCALPWVYLRPALRGYPDSIRQVVGWVAGALGACAGFLIAAWGASFFPGVVIVGRKFFGAVLLVEAIVGIALTSVIGAFKKLKAEVQAAESKAHEGEVLAAKAQASALQAQINPHFFFNTLNTLSALIPANPAAAQEVIGQLADMFRYTMACSQGQSVTLEQELSFVANYLKIEKARFSNRLQIELPAGHFKDILLPGLTLQPLVENAIRYGISKRVDGGTVRIGVVRNGASCLVTVTNPCEAADEPVFRDGHALANVRERLHLFADGRAALTVGKNGPESVEARVTVPVAAA